MRIKVKNKNYILKIGAVEIKLEVCSFIDYMVTAVSFIKVEFC